MSDLSKCTEACAAQPECVVCLKRKAPMGHSVPLEAATGYCQPGCIGYWIEPKPGHLWPEEWREEVERRVSR